MGVLQHKCAWNTTHESYTQVLSFLPPPLLCSRFQSFFSSPLIYPAKRCRRLPGRQVSRPLWKRGARQRRGMGRGRRRTWRTAWAQHSWCPQVADDKHTCSHWHGERVWGSRDQKVHVLNGHGMRGCLSCAASLALGELARALLVVCRERSGRSDNVCC